LCFDGKTLFGIIAITVISMSAIDISTLTFFSSRRTFKARYLKKVAQFNGTFSENSQKTIAKRVTR
jgi:hypothetical protein